MRTRPTRRNRQRRMVFLALLATVAVPCLFAPATGRAQTTGDMPLQILPDGPPLRATPRVDRPTTETGELPPGLVAESPTTETVPAASSIELEADVEPTWLQVFRAIRAPLFFLILLLVFIVLLLLSLRKKGPIRVSSVSARSIIISIIIHLFLLAGFDSWVISRRVVRTLRDEESELLIDSESLIEERVSLGIREETSDLPSADSTMAVAPEEARVPLPEIEPDPEEPPVLPGHVDIAVYELPEEITQPEKREEREPVRALAARLSPEFKFAPPLPSMEIPEPEESPEPEEESAALPEMELEKSDEPMEMRFTPEQAKVDLPATEYDASLEAGLVDLPALPMARPEVQESDPAARDLAERFRISAPSMTFNIDRVEPPEEPPEAPEPEVPSPTPEPARMPDESRIARATSLQPGSQLNASVVSMPAPTGVPDKQDATPAVPRRVLKPSPSPRPVPPPFTLEDFPALPEPYIHRQPEVRVTVLEEMGGTTETEEAVQDALKWLAAHQSADGRWDIDGFDNGCGKCGGPGTATSSDIAATALSLLAFLGAGHTHLNEGPHRETVEKAIRWLVAQEKGTGNLSGDGTMYDQGMATIALAEAYGMTLDTQLEPVVSRAVRYIAEAQHPETGGWRYFPGDRGDTSVFGWQVMGLKSARMAGLTVPDEVFKKALNWLEFAGGGEHGGLYGYQSDTPTIAMVAEGMFARQLLGSERDDAMMQESAQYVAARLPGQVETNFYYYYYGTLAMFQHQGENWKRWNDAMRQALMTAQETEGARKGSWAPVGMWSDASGRVVQTALATLCLEVYYRYLPLYTTGIREKMTDSDE